MKKTILILCLLLTVCILFACGGDEKPVGTVTTAGTESGSVETTAPVTEELKPDLPDVKFDGQTFKILSRTASGAYAVFTNFELYAEDYNSDIINDTVYERNILVEEKYGVDITQVQNTNPQKALQTSITAGDHAYDVIVSNISAMGAASVNGIFYSLYEVPHIDLDKPWWDQNAKKELSIANELLFTVSDWLLLDKARVAIIYYNKQMATDFGFDQLYSSVLDGSWTIDKMNEMMIKVSNDENGDGKVDLGDRFGLVSDSDSVFYYFYQCCGNGFVTKDEDDLPVLNWYTEKGDKCIDKLLTILRADTKTSLFPEEWAGNFGSSASEWSIPSDTFCAGRALFHAGIPQSANRKAADCDFEFGIIPFPKYDAAQERYYTIPNGNGSVLAVPIDSQTLEMTGVLLEELAYQSKMTVLPTWYEEWLKVRYTKDDESAQMLDLIYNNITYDLGTIFGWGGMGGLMSDVIGKSTTNIFASTYAANETKILTAMQDTVKAFGG